MALYYGENARAPRPETSGSLTKALLALLAALFVGAAVAYLVVPFEPANPWSQMIRAMMWW